MKRYLLSTHCVSCYHQNTALHYACSGGHAEAVQLLLDKRANVMLKNTYDQSPLEVATDYSHNDVAIIMLRHKRYL